MPTSQGFRGLRVYQLAFKLAMEIYQESKKFPREELYSLTDQIRRASRSVGLRDTSLDRIRLCLWIYLSGAAFTLD